MSVEDTGILCPNSLGNALLHFENLRPSRDERALEANDLVRHAGFINAPFRRFLVVGMMNENDPPRNPRANAKSVKSYFLTAHSGLIPRRTFFRSVLRVPEEPSQHQLPQPI